VRLSGLVVGALFQKNPKKKKKEKDKIAAMESGGWTLT